MAQQSPPFALQNASHSAALFRQAVASHLYQGGVSGGGELAVSAQATPNMTVQVAAGRSWIIGSQVASPSGFSWSTQGHYFGLNDGSVTLTIATSNTQPRIDLVYVAVNDQAYSGTTNNAVLGVVTGTPAASPGVPAAPNNSLVLAQVRVNANVTSVTNSNITDQRPLATPYPGSLACTSTTRPTNVWSGFVIYETDTGLSQVWDSSSALWRSRGAVHCTSTTRPSNPVIGQPIYETDTGNFSVYTGSAWFAVNTNQFAYAQLRQTVAQTGLTASTMTNINFDASDYDSASGHSPSVNPNRWTCPSGQAGLYAVEGVVNFANGPAVFAQVVKNGTAVPSSFGPGGTFASGGTYIAATGRVLVTLGVGDWVGVQGESTAASWATQSGSVNQSRMTVERLR